MNVGRILYLVKKLALLALGVFLLFLGVKAMLQISDSGDTLVFGFAGGLVCLFFALKGVLFLKKGR